MTFLCRRSRLLFQPLLFILQMVSKISYVESLSVLSGYEEAYSLCHKNFKMERWNCPMPKEIKNTQVPNSITKLYPTGKINISVDQIHEILYLAVFFCIGILYCLAIPIPNMGILIANIGIPIPNMGIYGIIFDIISSCNNFALLTVYIQTFVYIHVYHVLQVAVFHSVNIRMYLNHLITITLTFTQTAGEYYPIYCRIWILQCHIWQYTHFKYGNIGTVLDSPSSCNLNRTFSKNGL